MNTYKFYISLLDLAFLAVIFIGLTFAVLLWMSKTNKQAANRFLSLALVIVVFQITWLLGIDIQLTQYIPHWYRLPLQLSMALGPLIFFYVLKLIDREYKFRITAFLHFMPLLLQLGAHVLTVNESIRTGRPTYNTYTFQNIDPTVQLMALISVIIYLYQCHRLIKQFYKTQKFFAGDRHRHQWRWLHRFLKVFGLFWLLWLPLAVADRYYWHRLILQAYYPLYLLLTFLIIWLAAKTTLWPETIAQFNTIPVLKPLVPSALRQKAIWIKKTMKENHYFQDPNLNLDSLAGKLKLAPHELSRIINTVLKKSFNDFVNEYRVAAMVQKMHDPAFDHLTLLGIAFESGFNSKTTFNRTFKQVKGIKPADYKKRLKKERPSYNLKRYAQPATVVSYHNATTMWFFKKSNRNFMVRNYFKIAWRSLIRNKSYGIINVTGLAIGVAACLLIFLVVQYETSFDDFHTNRDQIYRVVNVSKGPDGVTLGSGTQLPLADALSLDFPQLKSVGSIMLNDGSHYSIDDENNTKTVKKFKEDDAYYADPKFFQIFSFRWLAGDKKTALAEPNTAVLSRGEADRFFGDWHKAIGRTFKYENKTRFKVTGIIENTPPNTDFPMKVLMSWITLISKGGELSGNSQNWASTFKDRNTYLILPTTITEQQFNTYLVAFTNKFIPAPYNKTMSLQLQPLKDMHYNTQIDVYGGHPFSKKMINVISLIGIFLLIIACVNFINLATAQAINRSKEVGIRKVLGSNRLSLYCNSLRKRSLSHCLR